MEFDEVPVGVRAELGMGGTVMLGHSPSRLGAHPAEGQGDRTR
jgi:hypothetical protein